MNKQTIHARPLSLSDRQLRLVLNASKAVPIQQRESFLQKVVAHLSAEPTDDAVTAALNAQLDRLPRYFLCDSKPETNK